MSYELHTREYLSIINDNSATREYAIALGNYIEHINHMISLVELYIGKLVLTVDGESVTVQDVECKSGNTFVYSDGNLFLSQADCTQWDDAHPLTRLAEKIKNARDITFYLSCDTEAVSGTPYGAQYWDRVIFENVFCEVIDRVTYKCLESYQVDEPYTAVIFKNGIMQNLENNSKFEDISDIKNWYDIDFYICFTSPEAFENTPIGKKAEQLAQEFNKTYGLCDSSTTSYFDCLYIQDCFNLDISMLNMLISDIQRLADFCKENDLTIKVNANLKPRENDFAVITITEENGKITPHYLRF